tara:strand:+ start:939 stop:1109 length:171 start_codon:yes stop_codon:yes gene_type:complete
MSTGIGTAVAGQVFSEIESGASASLVPFVVRVIADGGVIEARACLFALLNNLNSIQ